MPGFEIGRAPTWRDLTGSGATITDIEQVLSRYPALSFVSALSRIGSMLLNTEANDFVTQLAVVRHFIPHGITTVLLKIHAEKNFAGLINTHDLELLAQWAIKCGDTTDTDTPIDGNDLARVILSVNDLCVPIELRGSVLYSYGKEERDVAIARYALKISAQLSQESIVEEVVRYFLILDHHGPLVPWPAQVAISWDHLSQDVLGMTATEFFLAGMTILAAFCEYHKKTEERQYPNNLKAAEWLGKMKDPSKPKAFLKRCSFKIEELKRQILRRDANVEPWKWSLRFVRQSPLISLPNEEYRLVSLVALIRKMTLGLYYEVFNALRSRQREAFTEWLGASFELYVNELLARCYGGNCRSSVQEGGEQICDTAIILGDDCIVIETKWHFWTMSVVASGIMQNSDKEQLILKPSHQLRNACEKIAADPGLLGLRTSPRRFIPLVVGNVPFPQMPPLTAMISEAWEEPVLPGATVERPRIVSIQELESLLCEPEIIVKVMDLWREKSEKRELYSCLAPYRSLRDARTPIHNRYTDWGWAKLQGELHPVVSAWMR